MGRTSSRITSSCLCIQEIAGIRQFFKIRTDAGMFPAIISSRVVFRLGEVQAGPQLETGRAFLVQLVYLADGDYPCMSLFISR